MTDTYQMTKRQTFAIFCKTKVDVRNCKPTEAQVNQVFALGNLEAAELVKTWEGAQVKGSAPKPKEDYQALFDAAHAAGMAAVNALKVVPMVVNQHTNPLDDKSPVEKSYFVADGPCGFAWVKVRPANCGFAKWLKEKGVASTAYDGGMSMWIHDFNQSIQKKETYASAFAEVLRTKGLNAYAGSRMD